MKTQFFLALLVCNMSLFADNWLYNSQKSKTDANNYLFAETTSLTKREKLLVNHVKNAVRLSLKHASGLTQDILKLEGMSSTKNRCLLNNLLKLPNANYLEIGCWKGSTFISALYGNQNTIAHATAIDNWSEFDGSYMEFASNCSHYLQDGYKVYSHDCFSVDPKTIIKSPINIYFYDGTHSEEAQNKAFTYYNSVFDNTFIAIVDDWNHGHARNGTLNAFSQLKYKVVYEIYLPARYNGDQEQWWHGLYVAVVSK